MTQRSDFASALQDIRILEGEPGIHMRWQAIIRAAITAMEGVQGFIPIEEPLKAEPALPDLPETNADAEAAGGSAFDHDGDGHVGGSKAKVTTVAHVSHSHKGK